MLKRCLIAGVFLIGAGLVARPVVHSIKGWHARRLAQEAMRLMDQNNWRQATQKMQDALRLRPSEPAVIDCVAKLLSKTGQPVAALEWWKKVETLRPLNPSDRRAYASAALVANELALAATQINFLLAHQPVAAEDLILAAQLQTLSGHSESAIEYAERVIKDSTAPSASVFEAAVLLVTNTTPQSALYGTAIDRLIDLAREDQKPIALDALRLLAATRPRPRLTSVSPAPLVLEATPTHQNNISRLEVAERIEKHPDARARDQLLALQVRAANEPKRADEFTRIAMQKFQGSDKNGVAALAAWLYDRGEFEKVLQLVPVDRPTGSRELSLLRIDALAGLGRFANIREMLLNEDSNLDQMSQHVFLAVASAKLGESVTSSNEWQRALEAANGVPRLQLLAQYAEANRAFEIADAAYLEVLSQQPHLRSAYLARLRLAEASSRTRAAHDIAAEIVRLWPEDAATRIREIYLALLLGESAANMAAAERELDSFAAHNSLGWNARGTLALAHLRNGRPAAALSALEGFSPGTPPPNIVAIRANALAADGWKDKAHSEAKSLITAKLLPEERALIVPLLGQD